MLRLRTAPFSHSLAKTDRPLPTPFPPQGSSECECGPRSGPAACRRESGLAAYGSSERANRVLETRRVPRTQYPIKPPVPPRLLDAPDRTDGRQRQVLPSELVSCHQNDVPELRVRKTDLPNPACARQRNFALRVSPGRSTGLQKRFPTPRGSVKPGQCSPPPVRKPVFPLAASRALQTLSPVTLEA